MTIQEFIMILEEIEIGNNPKIEYNLHEGIQRIFGALGQRPSEFFIDVAEADSPINQYTSTGRRQDKDYEPPLQNIPYKEK